MKGKNTQQNNRDYLSQRKHIVFIHLSFSFFEDRRTGVNLRFFQPLMQFGFARKLAETRSHFSISPGLFSLERPIEEEGYAAYFDIPFPSYENIEESSIKLSWILPEKKSERALTKSFVLNNQPFYPHYVPDLISTENYSSYVESFLSLPEIHRQIFTLPVSMVDSQLIDQVIKSDCSLFILTGLPSQFNNQRLLSRNLVSIREKIAPDIAIYVPGPITPSLYSLLVYSGIDFFDNSLAYYTSKKGFFLSNDGNFSIQNHPSCFCPYCMESPPNFFKHNELVIKNALSRIRHSLDKETLRSLVEKDSHNRVSFAATLRKYDSDFSSSFRTRTPIVSSAPMICIGEESLSRPVVEEYRYRIETQYTPLSSTKIILLLPCSARKPYSFSRSHMLFRNAIKKGGKGIFSILSELIITSPLSVVPRELENIFPARFYDIPVAGRWTSEEIRITAKLLSEIFSKYHEDAVIINHMHGEGYEDIVEIVKSEKKVEVFNTSAEASPISGKSLSNLSSKLQEISEKRDDTHINVPSTTIRKLQAVADFQFGSGTGNILFSGSIKTKGRYPRDLHIFCEKELIASLSSENGFLSLSLNAAQSISSISHNILEFATNQVKGSNIYAPGCINADKRILPNDEVFVVFNNEVVATAQAFVSGKDMNKMTSGIVAEIKKKKRSEK